MKIAFGEGVWDASNDMPNPTFWGDRALLGILGVALALRLTWALSIPVVPLSDSMAYLVFAKSLVAGLGYAWADGTLTAYWPPGTSFIYAALFWLFGESFTPIVVLNLVAGIVLVYLGFRLARLFYGRLVGLLAAAMLAVFEKSKPKPVHFVAFGLLVAIAFCIRPTANSLLLILPVL